MSFLQIIPWLLSAVSLSSATFLGLQFTRLCISSNSSSIQSQCVLCRNRNFQNIVTVCTNRDNLGPETSEAEAFCLLTSCLGDIRLQYAPILGRRKRSVDAFRALRKSNGSHAHQSASRKSSSDLEHPKQFSSLGYHHPQLFIKPGGERQSVNDLQSNITLLNNGVIQSINDLPGTRYPNPENINLAVQAAVPNPSRSGRDRNLLDEEGGESDTPKPKRNDDITDMPSLESGLVADEGSIHLLFQVVEHTSVSVQPSKAK